MKVSKSFSVFSLLIALFCVFSLNSCSKKIGYSVVLWSIPEENLSDGTIVPVYIKSNIGHCYVIGVPNTDIKCEVPLWQITEPTSKHKVKALAAKFADYQNYYARVKLDGLPIRAEAQNTAKQVYRTREGEILKVLYKGNGAAVMAGNNALKGEWLRVLTRDGTLGWCFSYNLALFNENDKATDEDSSEKSENIYTDYLVKILSTTWYPEEYQMMINAKQVDLAKINPDYKFDTGYESGFVTLESEDLAFSFEYKGLTKASNRVYKFNESNLTMTIRSSASIFLQYVDSASRQHTVNLATLSQSLDSVIEKETQRRLAEYQKIVSAGPVFSSSNYGKINFNFDGTFEWSAYNLLVPAVIPQNSGNTGKVYIEYFISNALKSEFDGVLTFQFANKEVNFLYKIESNGLRLEDTNKAKFKEKVITEKSTNPVVMFFAN